MEERLITRLKWGLTAELDRPDLDLRKKILKNKISHDGVVIPDDVFNFIASNVTENVRDVEGIVASLLAYSTAFNRMIDLPLTKQVVSRVVKLEKKQVSVESIQDVVCKYYNLELAAIQTNSRKREIVQARRLRCTWRRSIPTVLFLISGRSSGSVTMQPSCMPARR